jgi:predicted acetyltransferase
VDVPRDHPLLFALVDADRARPGDAQIEHTLGEVAAGPMVRMTDVARSLCARRWPANGAVAIEVGQERIALRVTGGRAASAPTSAEPDVVLDARALAAVAFGALPVSDASRLGWLRARDDASIARFDALCALPPYFSPDPF